MDALIPFDAPAAPWPAGRPYDQPPMPARERRVQARAFEHWTTLRDGRRLPAIADLDLPALADLAPSSVLVELGRDERPPVIHFVGESIATTAGLSTELATFEAVPRASLLGQLIRRLPTVRDRGTPLSFEADFLDDDGAPTHYRGILLPFADEDGAITHVQAVIGWELVAAPETIDADLAASLGAALALAQPAPAASPWALARGGATERLPLAQQLAAARTWVALGEADPVRRAIAQVAALAAAHDIATAADPAALAALSGTAATTGEGIGEIVRLVFGRQAPRAERAGHMAVLAHARRLGIGAGMLAPLLERFPGGAAALAAAERRARRGLAAIETAAPTLGLIEFAAVDADHLLLLARRGPRRLDRAAPAITAGAGRRRVVN